MNCKYWTDFLQKKKLGEKLYSYQLRLAFKKNYTKRILCLKLKTSFEAIHGMQLSQVMFFCMKFNTAWFCIRYDFICISELVLKSCRGRSSSFISTLASNISYIFHVPLRGYEDENKQKKATYFFPIWLQHIKKLV